MLKGNADPTPAPPSDKSPLGAAKLLKRFAQGCEHNLLSGTMGEASVPDQGGIGKGG